MILQLVRQKLGGDCGWIRLEHKPMQKNYLANHAEMKNIELPISMREK